MWKRLEPILKKQGVVLQTLSPNSLEDKNTLLPHLLENIGVKKVEAALKELGLRVLTENATNIVDVIYINETFTILKLKIKGEDKDRVVGFSNNPFSAMAGFLIRSKATELNIKVSEIGFIYFKNSLFKQANKNKNLKVTDNLLDFILEKAAKNDISDIHINPRNDKNVAIYFREYGDIIESNVGDIKISEYGKFANDLIAKAGGNGGVYSTFLEGRFDFKNETINIAVRLQQNPTVYKFDNKDTVPSFVLRVHDRNKINSFKSIDEIEMLPEHKIVLKRAVMHNSGLIVVSGPTGSGKTTLLYAALAEALEKRKRIAQTIEDPVEIQVPGVRQISIQKKSGITYEAGIKAILRSDIDVALVGEIRSEETAKGVVELDRVGHLVFSTVHTKKTMAIIDRFRGFSVENSYIADSLSLLISTRLVKKVCEHCVTTQAASKLEIDEKYAGRFIARTDQLAVVNKDGCGRCVAGYHGRISVVEVIKIDNTLRDLIITNASAARLEKHVRNHGNKNIWDHAFDLVKSQQTTLEALESVLPTFSDFGDNFSINEHAQV